MRGADINEGLLCDSIYIKSTKRHKSPVIIEVPVGVIVRGGWSCLGRQEGTFWVMTVPFILACGYRDAYTL